MDKFSDPPTPGRRERSQQPPDRAGRPGAADRSTPGELCWGPDHWISSATLLAMLGALTWRLIDSDPENRVVAAVLVAVFAVVTLLLVRIRVRLRVVPGGIAVTGPLHTRRIDWSQIDSISMPRRGRFGRRGVVLELEIRPPSDGADAPARDARPVPATDPRAADTELFEFGRFDLGADPGEVGRTLLRLRP